MPDDLQGLPTPNLDQLNASLAGGSLPQAMGAAWPQVAAQVQQTAQPSPESQRIQALLQRALENDQQTSQALQREMQPGSIQQYLPKPTASGILSDLLQNFNHNAAAAHFGWQQPVPVQQQRLANALAFQQERLRALQEANVNNKNYMGTLMQQLQLQETQQRDRNLAAYQQGELANRQKQIDGMNQFRALNYAMRRDAYGNTFSPALETLTGQQLIDRGVTDIGNDEQGPIPVLTAPGITYVRKKSRLDPPGSDGHWFQGQNTSQMPTERDGGEWKINPLTQQFEYLPTKSVSAKEVPGETPKQATPVPSKAKPSSIAPPSPALQKIVGPPAKPDVKPFDPTDPTDYAALSIAVDARNASQFPKARQVLAQSRMAEFGMYPGRVPPGLIERSKLAAGLLPKFDQVEELINKADREGTLGVIASNWNRFLTAGEAKLNLGPLGDWKFVPGIDPSSDQIFAALSTQLSFLQSAVAMIHGGVRGGGSPQMVDHWTNTLQASDPATLKSKLAQARYWVNGYAHLYPQAQDMLNTMKANGQPVAADGPPQPSSTPAQSTQAPAQFRWNPATRKAELIGAR